MGRKAIKCKIEFCKKIEIGWLKKNGYLEGEKIGLFTWENQSHDNLDQMTIVINALQGEIRFMYHLRNDHDGEMKQFHYSHRLVSSPCFFGGVRYWFRCELIVNNKFCGKRVGALFKPPGQCYWGCRHCYNLTYDSRRITHVGSRGAYVQFLDNSCKIENLEKDMKRRTWAGKPTRKFKKLIKLRIKMGYLSADVLRH